MINLKQGAGELTAGKAKPARKASDADAPGSTESTKRLKRGGQTTRGAFRFLLVADKYVVLEGFHGVSTNEGLQALNFRLKPYRLRAARICRMASDISSLGTMS